MPVGDIPEVEAEIEALTPAVHGHWTRSASASLRDLTDELERMERDDELSEIDGGSSVGGRRAAVAAAVVALLLLMRDKVDRPPSNRQRARYRRSAESLILAGASSTGGLGRLRRRGPTIRRAVAQAEQDLVFLSRVRFQQGRMAERVDAALEEFLTQEDARRTRRARREAEREALRAERMAVERENARRARDGAPPLKAPEKAKLTVHKRKDGRDGALDRRDWVETLARDLSVPRQLTQTIVDTWAYRWYGLGAMMAERARGQTAIVAYNNPPSGPDSKTTPFCRWVHQRVIRIETTIRRIGRYRDLLQRGQDIEAFDEFWSFDTPDRAPDFRRHFADVGMPPYHARCRTVPRSTRTGAFARRRPA